MIELFIGLWVYAAFVTVFFIMKVESDEGVSPYFSTLECWIFPIVILVIWWIPAIQVALVYLDKRRT